LSLEDIQGLFGDSVVEEGLTIEGTIPATKASEFEETSKHQNTSVVPVQDSKIKE